MTVLLKKQNLQDKMSGLEVLSGVSSVCSLLEMGLKIYDAVKEVKSFKSQSKTLGNRIKIILLPVEALQKEVEGSGAHDIVLPIAEQLKRTGLAPSAGGVGHENGPLVELKNCMKDIDSFLLELGDTKWCSKFVHKKKIQDNFDSYNEQLTNLQRTLSLCLQVEFPKIITEEMKKQLSEAFDKDNMERQKIEDVKQDLESMKADLEELKQREETQTHIVENIEAIVKVISEELKCLHKEIHFKEQLKANEIYSSELRMQYSEFTDLETLQEGTYGPIIKTRHHFEDKLLVRKAFDDTDVSSQKELKKQLILWKNLRYSSFIVQLYGYTVDFESRMCFVVEYMAQGTLRSVLQDRENHPLPWEQRKRLARDCAQGLYAIHFGQGKIMLHRAVTSTRFLVDDRYRAKISDNGFVKSGSNIKKSTTSSGGRGSVERDEMNYLCPEETGAGFKRTIKSEVYKFGVILYEIASRMLPFQAKEKDGTPLTHGEKRDFIRDGNTEDPPADTPEAFRNLIHDCRLREPKERPTTDVVVTRLSEMC